MPRHSAASTVLVVVGLMLVVFLAPPAGASARAGRWTPVPVSLPAGSWHNANFVHIACTSATNCFASGEVRNATDAAAGEWTSGVIERWNGSRFSLVPLALSHTGLGAISCVTATSCWVVATKYPGIGIASTTAILHWNGNAWNNVKNPSPTGGSALDAVACLSVAKCFAVGASYSGSGSHTMLEQWNGTSWTLGTIPTPAGQLSAIFRSSPA